MEWDEFLKLKHGDKVRFIGEWNPSAVGEIDEVWADSEGNAYLPSGHSLYPLNEFNPHDWEKVEEN